MNEFNAIDKQQAGAVKPPAVPVNWYMLAGSREIARGKIVTRDFQGRDFVIYRSRETGKVSVFHARCAHMGCHLKHAIPQADGIRCGLHNRLIAADGNFESTGNDTARRLQQPKLLVQEAFGGVFVWIGPQGQQTPLPMPAIATDGPVMARYVGEFAFDIPWFNLIANGLDMEHLVSIHGRALREDPIIDTDVAGRFKISYLTRVVGRTLSDRIIKWLSADHIRASMAAIGGSLMLVESKVSKPSFALLSMAPRADGGTVVRAIIGANGATAKPLDALRLRITSWLFRRFLAADFEVLNGLDWRPPEYVLVKSDAYSRKLYSYFCDLKEANHV